MADNLKSSWFNYKTGEWDSFAGSPGDYSLYIPQNEAAQGAYRCRVALGETPAQAAIAVLLLCVGESPPELTTRKNG